MDRLWGRSGALSLRPNTWPQARGLLIVSYLGRENARHSEVSERLILLPFNLSDYIMLDFPTLTTRLCAFYLQTFS